MNRPARILLRYFPALGVAVAGVILAFAAARYPGGYDWWGQSVSSLFQPMALNSELNAARWTASIGVILFCASMAVVFAIVARQGVTRSHQKTIQIGGIGSMVYAALLVTPMHDALVSVALLFFVVAMIALLHSLFAERRFRALAVGIASLGLVAVNASLYFGALFGDFLPFVQKLSLCLWSPWLLVLSLRETRVTSNRNQTAGS